MAESEHWGTYLVEALEEPTDVTITVNPNTTEGGMMLLGQRIRGIFDALSPRRDLETGDDPLVEEDPADLLRLVDHLHRVVSMLSHEEDRVIEALRERETPVRRIASAMEVDKTTVSGRLRRIARARTEDIGTMALTEREADEAMSPLGNRDLGSHDQD